MAVRGRMAAVLLVEDEALLREVSAEILRDAGLTVFTAANAREARDVLAREGEALGLLFTDIDLGEGPDGLALARAARERRPDLPVLLASGSRRGLAASERVEGAAFLPKPYGFARMGRAVAEAMGLRAAA